MDDTEQGRWEPLPPGVHEYDGGSVIIDEDGFWTRTYSMSLRDMTEGQSGVPPMPFRLCRRVPMRGRKWTEAEEEKLRALLLSGLPPHQIAKRLGRTTRAIRTRWLKLGLGRRQLLSLKMIERNNQHK